MKPDRLAEETFAKLRPVEAYLLMNPRRYKLDECFRLIFVDLILRGILGYREEIRRVSAASAPSKFHLVYQNPHSNPQDLLPYERLFLSPLKKVTINQAFWIRPYGHELIQNILGDREQLPLEIFKSTTFTKAGKTHWSSWFTGWFKLNQQGKQVATTLTQQLTKGVSSLVADHEYKHLTSLGSGFILLSITKYRPKWFNAELAMQFLKSEYQLDEKASKTVAKLLLDYPLADYFYEDELRDNSSGYDSYYYVSDIV